MFQPCSPLSLITLLLIACVLSSCASGADDSETLSIPVLSPRSSVDSNLESSGVLLSDQNQTENQPATLDRIVITDATLRLTVETPESVLTSINSLAVDLGGWVVSSNSQTFNYVEETYKRASTTIRIPSERLNQTLDMVKSQSVSVDSESITGQDVTQQFVDQSSRLRNLQDAEEQLQAIMDNAENTEAVLSVYNELVRIRGEIESIQGNLNYWQEAAAFSSITVYLEPVLPDATEIESQLANNRDWDPGKTVKTGFAFLIGIVQFLVDFAILLVIVVLPLGLLIGVPSYIGYRILKRRERTAS